MKKSKKIIIIVIVILLIITGVGVLVWRGNKMKKMSNVSQTTTTQEVKVSYRNISNTLSSSGQISTALSESLSLHTGYYLEEILVEENQYVEKGTNLIKYTNGNYKTAPYSGVVTSWTLPKEEGKIINSHSISMSTTETLQISLSVSEKDIDKIELGQKVTIVPTAYENTTYEGYITSISQIGNYSSSGSSFTVYATFENDGQLKIGMSATVTVILESAENAMVVPTEAIQKANGVSYVVVVKDDGTTENVTVTTGVANDAYTQILSGLSGTETVQMIETSSNSSGGFNMGNFSGFSGGDMPSGFSGGDMPSGFSGGGFSGGGFSMPGGN